MSAHVFQVPNSGDAQAWQAKCFGHSDERWGMWLGSARPHTDAGLTKAFADRDKHNRVEHPNV